MITVELQSKDSVHILQDGVPIGVAVYHFAQGWLCRLFDDPKVQWWTANQCGLRNDYQAHLELREREE